MTGTTLASAKFFVSQKATVHKDIALNEGRVMSLELFSLLHRAYCESLKYHTNHCTYIQFIISNVKTLLHVSVLRPSSGSHNFLAKVTL